MWTSSKIKQEKQNRILRIQLVIIEMLQLVRLNGTKHALFLTGISESSSNSILSVVHKKCWSKVIIYFESNIADLISVKAAIIIFSLNIVLTG
jgi:hypothetical protein